MITIDTKVLCLQNRSPQGLRDKQGSKQRFFVIRLPVPVFHTGYDVIELNLVAEGG